MCGCLLALALLPLLIGIWLWALARGSVAVWRVRTSRTRELLAQQLGIPVGDLVSLRDSGLLRLRDQVAFDELTGVACRAAGMAALERELSSARRERVALSVAFIDVDGLKATNDWYDFFLQLLWQTRTTITITQSYRNSSFCRILAYNKQVQFTNNFSRCQAVHGLTPYNSSTFICSLV